VTKQSLELLLITSEKRWMNDWNLVLYLRFRKEVNKKQAEKQK
jgi:hypothetical protein